MRLILSLLFCFILSLAALGQQSVGVPAQSFNGTTMDGKEINLDDMKGKVVVMTFWSTRCDICHHEIPRWNKLAEKYAGKDVVFMALTMENETKVDVYIKKQPIKFLVMPNSLGVVLKYADRDRNGNMNMGYPAYYVVDQQGEVLLKTDGWDKVEKLDSQINKLLSSAASAAPKASTDASSTQTATPKID